VEICWWVIDAAVGTEVEVALDRHLTTWIERDWPFQNPRFIGRDLSWREWLDLPDA
jgi:hypothetical protein